MKFIIASDIHGSHAAVKELIQVFNNEKADRILLLGDFLYHGPRNPLPKDYNPAKVAQVLNQYKDKIIAVRGNCDSEVDRMVLEFPIMETYTQLHVDNYTFFLTHGHVYHSEHLPKLHGQVIFMSGHTHVPQLYYDEANDLIFMNPGSISMPKGEYPSTYGVYEQDKLEIKTLEQKVILTYEINKN